MSNICMKFINSNVAILHGYSTALFFKSGTTFEEAAHSNVEHTC